MAQATLRNFVTDGSDRSVQNILSKLRFISKFKPDERICIKNLSIQSEGFGSWISRWWSSEGRDATLDFLRTTVGEALDLAISNLRRDETFYKQIGLMLLTCLEESRQGMTSLTKTYENDRMFVSEVETLREMVGLKSAELYGKKIECVKKIEHGKKFDKSKEST